MKRVLLLISLLFALGQLLAQGNWLLNGDFEEAVPSVKESAKRIMYTWWGHSVIANCAAIGSPNGITPELGYKWPGAEGDSIMPYSGQCMVGLIAYSTGQRWLHREYVVLELNDGLKLGEHYMLSFMIYMDKRNHIYVDNVGALFLDYIPQSDLSPILSEAALTYAGRLPTDTWARIAFEFKPQKDGLRYLCLGNFSPDEAVRWRRNRKNRSRNRDCYVLIDDVQLRPLDSSEIER